MSCTALGLRIHLRPKVFQILAYLLAHRDRVVPKAELLEHVWPNQFIGDATLNACIKDVRKAMGDGGRTPRFLHTLHGQGYRFVAAVVVQEHLPVDAAPPALPLHEGREGHPPGRADFTSLAPPLPDSRSISVEVPDGEHKQVTVLCGALAEAPALAARLGSEAMYHLMREVLALVQDTVQHYEGILTDIEQVQNVKKSFTFR